MIMILVYGYQDGFPMVITPYHPDHLPELRSLVNHHLNAVMPGWSLPTVYIEQHLTRNPRQPIIDPWVTERQTLVVVEKQRVVAATHLLRYGMDEAVGEHYWGAGDVAWLLAWNEHRAEATALLHAVQQQMERWNAARIFAWDSHLPTPIVTGIPDVWPHLHQVFRQAGFEPMPERSEALYGGWLRQIPLPVAPPVDGMAIQRTARRMWGVGFTVWLGDQEIGHCECVADLTEGGAVPSFRGWAELGELFIQEGWRGRGVGRWLVQHVVEWLRLAGCDRIVLSCAQDDEAAGAGRFYRRLGWDVFSRLQDGWYFKQPTT